MEKSKLDLAAFGWAVSGTLALLLILCEAAVVALPGWPLAHTWLALFSTAEIGSLRNLIEGIISSVIFGWIAAAILVIIYNRSLAGRRRPL